MRLLKIIVLLIFLMGNGIIFSQNAKENYTPPSPLNLPPEANFSWLHACLGDSTCFINQTIRGNTYTWTVSDTNSHHSTTYYTSHNDSGFCYLFTKGYYYVSLTAYNNHTVTIKKLIVIDTVTKADFSFTHCANYFINTSSCASSFYWDFGDGSTSTLTTPTHQYADTGHYKVTLIAYKGGITDTMKKTIFVDVESFVSSTFTNYVSHDTVFVHAAYTGVGVSCNWSWSDGTYSTGQDTFHVYKDSTANYLVSLFIQNSCGPKGSTATVSITKPEPPANLNFDNTTLLIVPNPVANNSYLEAFYTAYTDDSYLGQVYNALGQKMFEANFAFTNGINGFKINTSDFSAGMYVLTLQSGNSFVRRKFYISQTDK